MGVVRPDAISKDPILRGGSMKMLAVFLFFVSTVFAQSVQVIPWKPAPARATSNGPLKSSGGQQTRHAYFQSDDSVFPHLATGGGWETVIVIVNMSAATMQYSTYFYNQNGGPMSVTFRESPSGNIVNATAIASTLPPGAVSTSPYSTTVRLLRSVGLSWTTIRQSGASADTQFSGREYKAARISRHWFP